MSKRRELVDRWRAIEEDLEEPHLHPLRHRTLRQLKDQWFSDAFGFLTTVPEGLHLWCGFWDLMGPLLETFHGYFQEEEGGVSPLRILWKRASGEMRTCTQCICQHRQAQEMYRSEYEPEAVEPLLKVVRALDGERVLAHLQEMNVVLTRKAYDPELHGPEVVSIMFEVLTFPVLLEDQLLIVEFESFIEAIDHCHELSLAGDQQYPGVFVLLFLRNSKARAIGLRLAGTMGKLRSAMDLEPLQPLLSKYIGILETEVLPSNSDSSRSKIQHERMTVWLGFKALLAFLEVAAFEEGILERYPIFLSIILNHVSDDTPEFSYAVTCLRLFFQMLGCKLWLRTTLSPSMMRNTLLGQCFHTRNEKSHKEIFDLFLPFLQSLESLQDGEFEKQRRHFLYFLLHQVTKSSNFSFLMRKNACKIALLIVQRGYRMNPPCPPFDCCHMWGPSLSASLKDSSLHSSLRQPAIDLIESIIISDCAALVSLKSGTYADSGIAKECCDPFNDEDEVPTVIEDKEGESCCWTVFSFQSKLAARECKDWRCIPVLWVDTFVQQDPSLLPISFHNAVLWVVSHISMTISDSSIDMKLSVSDWLASEAAELLPSFEWEVPKGYDDGEDGSESNNSVRASVMCISLLRALKRCASHFFISVEQGSHKLWTWESRMAESLILLLIDPNDTLRQVNRLILEHVSKTRGLTSGLLFLCRSPDSLSAVNIGLRYATKLAQLDPDLKSFSGLHHLFFVVRKLLKEAAPLEKSSAPEKNLSYSSLDGGFLRSHSINSSPEALGFPAHELDKKSWTRFCCLLSECIWPFSLKCLEDGKKYVDDRSSQMTCVRLLETLPVIFETIVSQLLPLLQLGQSSIISASLHSDLNWLFDLVEWGKSSLAIVIRHWKQYMPSMLNILERCHGLSMRDIVNDLQKIICSDVVAVDQLMDQIHKYIHSIKNFRIKGQTSPRVMDLLSESSYLDKKKISSAESIQGVCKSNAIHIMDPVVLATSKNDFVILSDDDDDDDDDEKKSSLEPVLTPSIIISNAMVKKAPHGEAHGQTQEPLPVTSLSEKFDNLPLKDVKHQTTGARKDVDCVIKSSVKVVSENKRHEAIVEMKSNVELQGSKATQEGEKHLPAPKEAQGNYKQQITTGEIVSDAKNDPLEEAFTFANHSRMILSRPSISVPKRKVIQLQMPIGERPGYPTRMHADKRRHKPPKLDDWYRPILEFDYFSVAGLSSDCEDKSVGSSLLKEVPLCFKSPDHYVEIFRPLVLEEFKAQLHNSYMEASSSDDISSLRLSVLSVERVDDFHHVRGSPVGSESTSRGYMENDLILLTKEPLQSASQSLHALGKVERHEKSNKSKPVILTLRFYLQSTSTRLVKIRRLLMERSKWYITHIMSMTPQLREFQVLSSLNDVPLMPAILNPVNFSPKHTGLSSTHLPKLSQSLRNSLKSSFNDSQLQAIGMVIGNGGFTKATELSLIQGPPGTGKTRTIVAIVSVLLALDSSNIGDNPGVQNRGLRLGSGSSSNVTPVARQAAAVARAWQDAALAKQLVQEEEKSKSSLLSRRFKRRVLVCAQSNAAVDELVARISCGIYGNDGKLHKPYLVRVGNLKTVHPCSLPFFIDTLVQHQLAEHMDAIDTKKTDTGAYSSMTLRTKLEKVVDNIRLLESMRAKLRDSEMELRSSDEKVPVMDDGKEMSESTIGVKLNRLYAQKKSIYADLAAAQSNEKRNSEEIKLLRTKIRRSIIREAEIVVTTLSGCGGDIYGVCSEDASNNKPTNFSEYSLFDAVVIDEAAQALEPATLIPLQLLKSSGTKCIMVGDPKQLPATVLSNLASKFFYQCSMFERLQRAGYPVTMLTEQYRMHPEICKFPSLHFYEKKLINGSEVTKKSVIFHENTYLGPYIFYDVVDGREQSGKGTGSLSLCNEAEAEVAVELMKILRKRYPSEFAAGKIGVVTPYKRQLSVLRFRFSNEFGPEIITTMEFNTIDGFQGREVDILLLSTVRASVENSGGSGVNPRSIGFVADARRMNVALTRAKLSLWIFGNARTLQMNAHWSDLIQDAKARGLFVSIHGPYRRILEKLLSPVGHMKLGENKCDIQTANCPKLKSGKNKLKQTGRNKCSSDMKHKFVSDNPILTEGMNSCHFESTSGSALPSNERENGKQRSLADGSSCKDSIGEGVAINSSSRIEKDPAKRSKPKNSQLSPHDSLSRRSSQSKSDGNRKPEKRSDSFLEVSGEDVTPIDSNLIRKRQRDAVDALLPSSFISSKKRDSSKSNSSVNVTTTVKANSKPLKKGKS